MAAEGLFGTSLLKKRLGFGVSFSGKSVSGRIASSMFASPQNWIR
jgi:hypothetical protein